MSLIIVCYLFSVSIITLVSSVHFH